MGEGRSAGKYLPNWVIGRRGLIHSRDTHRKIPRIKIDKFIIVCYNYSIIKREKEQNIMKIATCLKSLISACMVVGLTALLLSAGSFVYERTERTEGTFIPRKAPSAQIDQIDRIGDAMYGRVVYEDYCTGCHQADGTGMNGMLGANFTDEGRMKKTNDELLESIKSGFKGKNGVMPPWEGTLSDKQMKDVLQYIREAF